MTGRKDVGWDEGVDPTPDIFGANRTPSEESAAPRIPTGKTHIEADPSENESASPKSPGDGIGLPALHQVRRRDGADRPREPDAPDPAA